MEVTNLLPGGPATRQRPALRAPLPSAAHTARRSLRAVLAAHQRAAPGRSRWAGLSSRPAAHHPCLCLCPCSQPCSATVARAGPARTCASQPGPTGVHSLCPPSGYRSCPAGIIPLAGSSRRLPSAPTGWAAISTAKHRSGRPSAALLCLACMGPFFGWAPWPRPATSKQVKQARHQPIQPIPSGAWPAAAPPAACPPALAARSARRRCALWW